eukprot:7700523-Ditylum_brightwellii.AAC.1
MSYESEANAPTPAKAPTPAPALSSAAEDDVSKVMEVIPPGKDARATAESLLKDAGGDPSAALDMYFSRLPSICDSINPSSTVASSSPHYSSQRGSMSPIKNPYEVKQSYAGQKRSFPA